MVGFGVFAVLVAGGSLAMTRVGPFGAYWVMDRIRASEYEAALSSTVAAARGELGKDTFPSAQAAFGAADRSRREFDRVEALTAYAAYLANAAQVRFGAKVGSVPLGELQEDEDVPFLTLARAAEAAAQGQLARARQLAAASGGMPESGVDAAVLSGEIELRAGDAAGAVAAWKRAVELERSARTVFGLARAEELAGNHAAAEKLAEEATTLGPDHAGARLLLARLLSRRADQEGRARTLVEQVAEKPDLASKDEQVAAYALLGQLNLRHSRISQAEAAFRRAIELDPSASVALTGLAETYYAAGRYTEALARYRAAVNAEPDSVSAQLGAVKAQLALGQLDVASGVLAKLTAAHPKNASVLYWTGVTQEKLGNAEQAEQSFRKALELAAEDSESISAYVSLATLLNRRGDTAAAEALLNAAAAKLPNSPAIHRALGNLALDQGHFEDALRQFDAALELDREDVGARFLLGVTHRRMGHFEDAAARFAEVAEVDAGYPGLALERGLLFEASGRSEEALREYEAALVAAPDDPDLMLRVGCARVGAGRGADAEPMLGRVVAERKSAEAYYCLGRAKLLGNAQLVEAQRALQRATELDPNRPEYFLYLGWAASEAGQVPTAERALKTALELDRSYADAYWQRGVLRQRQGRAGDAVRDLQRALELRPGLTDARATLAGAEFDLGHQAAALTHWARAIEERPNDATWRFRYGKLLALNGQQAAARAQFLKALELAAEEQPPARWAAEAHRLIAESLGNDAAAVAHWQAFLTSGPPDSPYRADAKAALARLGKPWEGD